jgi:hypothetical protein
MSITIQQYAGQLNLANSDMLWEVTSNQSTQPQYQFITNLQSGCGTVLTSVKQQPNPSYKGVFNLGRITKQYLGFDTAQFTMGADGLFYKNTNTGKFFKVAFGEEYGTSTTSSVNVYNGITTATTGSPAYTGSIPYYFLINGTIDPNYGYWNWQTGSFYNPQTTPSSATFNYNVALTDSPRSQSAKSTDYLTIGVINGALNGSTTVAQDIYAVDLNVYYTGTLAYTASFYNESPTNVIYYGGPRTSKSQLWSAVSTVQTCSINSGSQSSGSFLLNVGIGPQNISNYGNFNFSTQNWDYYTVTLRPQQASNTINTNASWDKFTITKQDFNCGYAGVRFAWINDYGMWDWFNFTLQTDLNTDLERGLYQQTFVPYNTSTNDVTYNIQRRGTSTYFTNIVERYTANSDWLTQAEADWIQGMFYSPNVYIQEGFNMIPIIITDNTFVTRTNPRTQKNFQYAVNYTLANNKRSR